MSALFSTFGIDWRLLVIQLINFSLLLTALWYFLYGPVMRIIDERRDKIAAGVRTAEAASRRLEEAKAEGDALVGDAAKQAEGLVAAARSSAEEKRGDILKEAQMRADMLMSEASERAQEAQRRAIAESEREIARAAMLAAEKILKEKVA